MKKCMEMDATYLTLTDPDPLAPIIWNSPILVSILMMP